MSVMSTEASGTPTRSKYDRLIAAAQKVPAVPTLVVHPCDESSLRGAVDDCGSRHHQADPGGACGQDQGNRRQVWSEHHRL